MKNCILLFSGGIDSTACLHYYLEQEFVVNLVFINYGQISSENEFKSAKKIASYYDIDLNYLNYKPVKRFSKGEIMGRNAFLILAALLNYPEFKGIISLGIHSEVPYYDCSELFFRDMQNLIEGYTDGQVIIDAPFLQWDKKTIYEYCKNNDIPIYLTYSCESGTDKPCGECSSCKDRRYLNVI
ncbi:MAG: tRNA methyl transferase-like protein [Candidatus Methanofastidiosa archaeon]|nr:tRNA methyl transferase-like protein [Candidatus Methanofastidiosa archaeon]